MTSADERSIAVELYNGTWTLLQQDTRTPDEDDRMLHMAHASRFHWDNVGTDQHRAIGEWQVSRVYVDLGRGGAAVFHAERATSYASREGVEDWVLATAHEGLSRAHAAAGDLAAARVARDEAVTLAGQISDDEDRDVVLADIASLPFSDGA